ncbi:MAG TPA: ATP-binding protein [Puia sp.]|jgi:PAS domain S-box-containing protein|nr:ATP-binding protein [Puia sp.]
MIKDNDDIVLMRLSEMLNDASIDRVMAIDAERKLIAWNKTSENISGIKKEELIGKNLMDVFPQLQDDAEIISAIENAIKGKTSFVPSKPGSFNRNFYENHFIPLKDKDENILGVMNIMHDVSHRIKAERELERLNKALQEKYQQLETVNAELATFTSITGNDLKEPIQKLYTSLEFIIKNDSANLSNASKANLRRLQSSINRIHLLLDDLLKLSTVSSFSQNFSDVNLNEVLSRVLKDLNEKILNKQARISFEELPAIYGSTQMIYYLFYNLISNSLKFQHEEKIPEINISFKPSFEKDEKKFVVIIFSDNGIGFEQSESEKIFKLFEKLNPEKKISGSGIGLTICRKIMEAHGGYIEAEGNPDNGAIFKCYFSPAHN